MYKLFVFFIIAIVAVSARQVTVEVQMTNLAPVNGANLTPLWVAFHDGTFDSFNPGSSASSALESLAEDGATAQISSLFLSRSSRFIDGTIPADSSAVPVVQFGQTATAQFVLDSDEHTHVSLLSMVVPSNDAFVGNRSPDAYKIFDDDEFDSLTVTWEGTDVWDAGTEVNDEVPENTAFYAQAAPNTGVNENGDVDNHEGLNAPGTGGIVDQPEFANCDFSANNYVVGRVTIREVGVVSSGSSTSVSSSSNSSNDDDDDNSSNDDDDDNNADDDDSNSSSAASSVSVAVASIFAFVCLMI